MKKQKQVSSFFVLFLLVFLLPQPAAAYSIADFEGTWIGHQLYTGDAPAQPPAWCYLTDTWNSSGVHPYTITCSSGAAQPSQAGVWTSTTWNIANNGIITVPGYSADRFHGAISINKKLAVFTETLDSNNQPYLTVSVKQVPGTSFSSSDFQGTWYMHYLISGDWPTQESGWGYGTITVGSDGNASYSTTNHNGQSDSGTLPWTSLYPISSTGIITYPSVPASNFHGVMSDDKTIFVYAQSEQPKNQPMLGIMLKRNPNTTYSAADLKGRWTVHTLTTGDNPQWIASENGTLAISSAGVITWLSVNRSDGDSSLASSFTLSVSSIGTITCNTMTTLHGAISYDKNLIVLTMNDGGGGYNLAILSRQAGDPAILDLNNDGKVDFLWRYTPSGALAYWLMDGVTITAGGGITTLSTDWQLTGTPDLNGDGKADLLWRHTPTGTIAYWIMSGASIASTGTIGSVPSDWRIAGTPDLNADGSPDILWQHTPTGTIAVWYMNGTTQTSSAVITGVGTDWQIAGTPDINGDGKPDILWRQTSTGLVAYWLMDGITITAGGGIATVPSNWHIVGTPDLNADGKPDLLWHDSTTGTVSYWYMDGATITGGGAITTVPTDWDIIAPR